MLATLPSMLARASARFAVWPVVVAGLVLVAPGDVIAQADGVYVDPDSPAGKEYALPLDAARREASGGGGGGDGGASAPPLFGAGISNRGDSAKAARDGGRPSEANRTPDGGSAGGGDASQAASQAARVVADGAVGLSAGVVTVLIGLAVLLVGAAVGLSVRHFRGTYPRG